MEKDREIHEVVVDHNEFVVTSLLIKNNIGFSYNINNEFLKGKNVGDYILLKSSETGEELLLEIIKKEEKLNNEFSNNSSALEDIYDEDDDETTKITKKWYVEEYTKEKSFITMNFSVVNDLTKMNSPKKILKK